MKQKQEEEEAKVNKLISDAEDYYKVQKIYEYIAALEVNLKNINDELELEKLKGYIAWAKQKADWLNPLIAREDELLDKVIG